MPSQQDITDQQELLTVYRRALEVRLRQQAKVGREDTSPEILNDIVSTRNEIKRIKSILNSWGIAVDDIPSESSTPDTIIRDFSQIQQFQNKPTNERSITKSVLLPLVSSIFGVIFAVSINFISDGTNIPSYIVLLFFIALIALAVVLMLSDSNK